MVAGIVEGLTVDMTSSTFIVGVRNGVSKSNRNGFSFVLCLWTRFVLLTPLQTPRVKGP